MVTELVAGILLIAFSAVCSMQAQQHHLLGQKGGTNRWLLAGIIALVAGIYLVLTWI